MLPLEIYLQNYALFWLHNLASLYTQGMHASFLMLISRLNSRRTLRKDHALA